MPARKQAEQQLLGDFTLPDDHFREFAEDALTAFSKLLDRLFLFLVSFRGFDDSLPMLLVLVAVVVILTQCVIAYVTILIPSGYAHFSEYSLK